MCAGQYTSRRDTAFTHRAGGGNCKGRRSKGFHLRKTNKGSEWSDQVYPQRQAKRRRAQHKHITIRQKNRITTKRRPPRTPAPSKRRTRPLHSFRKYIPLSFFENITSNQKISHHIQPTRTKEFRAWLSTPRKRPGRREMDM